MEDLMQRVTLKGDTIFKNLIRRKCKSSTFVLFTGQIFSWHIVLGT